MSFPHGPEAGFPLEFTPLKNGACIRRLQDRAIGLAEHDTAGRGDHGWLGSAERVEQHLGLERPEDGLTVGEPDLPDGATRCGPRSSRRSRATVGRASAASARPTVDLPTPIMPTSTRCRDVTTARP